LRSSDDLIGYDEHRPRNGDMACPRRSIIAHQSGSIASLRRAIMRTFYAMDQLSIHDWCELDRYRDGKALRRSTKLE
jgi:hypothetical protein